LRDIESNAYESIWDIIEFYRIQPKVQELQLEKIEEYLVLMNAYYQESMVEIGVHIGSEDVASLSDIIDVLNSYLSLIGEEIKKIFSEDENMISPIEILSGSAVNELQTIELLRRFNEGDRDVYEIKEALDRLETLVYEEDFVNELSFVIRNLITKINSDVIVRVDDLI